MYKGKLTSVAPFRELPSDQDNITKSDKMLTMQLDSSKIASENAKYKNVKRIKIEKQQYIRIPTVIY